MKNCLTEKYLTAQEVQELLRIGDAKLWRLRGQLGGFQVGSSWRYPEESVADFIQRQRAKVQREVARV